MRVLRIRGQPGCASPKNRVLCNERHCYWRGTDLRLSDGKRRDDRKSHDSKQTWKERKSEEISVCLWSQELPQVPFLSQFRLYMFYVFMSTLEK